MRDTNKQRRQLEQQLKNATSYGQWYAIAERLDELEGSLQWREESGSELLHETLIREHIDAMVACREAGDTRALTRVLQESLYRHPGEIANPDLYSVAWTGTKYLVTEFLDEVERSMNFICDHRMPGASAKQAAASLMHAQVATTLKVTRNTWSSSIIRPLLEQAHAMATQTYLGDINIQFPFRPLLYRKLLTNPDREDLEMFIRLGEQATWPRLAMIRDQTRISRTFSDCIARLKRACTADDRVPE